ncbi:MAG TPA: chromosomal replication initiator protein DnaA [Candidatus Hydrogenedentes bacterium]|nr:chromosomal replication initiator protein DnaA [Candidatus Hydrogenedentota bacterium]
MSEIIQEKNAGEITKKSNPWNQAQTVLRNALDEYSYKNWFVKTAFDAYEEGVLRVRVPNSFFANWLEEHYHDTVLEVLKQVVPDLTALKYVVSSETEFPTDSAVKSQAELASLPRTVNAAPKRSFSGFNPKYTLDRFVIGGGNRFAHAAAKAVIQSPGRAYNPLFLYGDTGLGKTHLMQAVGQSLLASGRCSRVAFISSEAFTNELIQSIAEKNTHRFRMKYRRADILLIDDIHFIAGKEATQEEFFHTFNTLFDDHKQIVISSDCSPKGIEGVEQRLVSRFEWGLVTDIQPPDLETRMAILQNKAKLEHINVPSEVLRYIATYITSNIRELEGALTTVHAYSKLTEQKITLSAIENVLLDLIGNEKIKPISVEQVQRAVAEHFDVRIADLRGKSRQRQVVFPRQVGMFLCRTLMPNLSLSDIGEHFGGRDHTTVIYACEKVSQDAEKDRTVRQTIDKLTKTIRS